MIFISLFCRYLSKNAESIIIGAPVYLQRIIFFFFLIFSFFSHSLFFAKQKQFEITVLV
jgi:hypothetical protein